MRKRRGTQWFYAIIFKGPGGPNKSNQKGGTYMYEEKTRITYYDLDFREKIKLSALLRMVHIAADVNANELGIGFTTLFPLNMSFVLQRFGLKTHRMPVYDEVVTIRTWPAEMARGTFIRSGDMHDQNGKKLMEWSSLWILFDLANRAILKPSALPMQVPTLTDVEVNVKPEKVKLPQDEIPVFSQHAHTVRYADVDTNMHMNNSIYGDLVGNAVFANGDVGDWKEVQINYLGEARLGEEITVTSRKDGDEFLVVGTAQGRVSFSARVLCFERVATEPN